MATVTIVLTDHGDEGDIAATFDYGKKFDPDSEAHSLAAELSMELSKEQTDD